VTEPEKRSDHRNEPAGTEPGHKGPSHETPARDTRHRVILGDARRMAELEAESVHLVVTSPPYWQLKD